MVLEQCAKCRVRTALQIIHPSDQFLCQSCADYNDRCVTRRETPEWAVFLADRDRELATSVFEIFSSTINDEQFTSMYVNELNRVHEYDKTEIVDFLMNMPKEEKAKINLLLTLRLSLYDALHEQFPGQCDSEMYNRRKVSNTVEDIYVIGYSLVNKLMDKRLCKTLKKFQIDQDTTAASIDDSMAPLLNHVDIMETCGLLRDTITELKCVMTDLKGEVKNLKDKVAGLEIQLERSNSNDPVIITPPGRTEDTDNVPARPDVEDTDNYRPLDNVSQPSVESDTLSQNIADEELANGFRLQPSVRRQMRRGNRIQPDSDPSSGTTHRVRAARPATSRLTPIYVGRLSPDTSELDVRGHLQDIQVRHVADVIPLRRADDWSSYCVTLDNTESKNKLCDLSNWPAGVVIRPYKDRPKPSKQNTQFHKAESRTSSDRQSGRLSSSYQSRRNSERQRNSVTLSSNESHRHRQSQYQRDANNQGSRTWYYNSY